MRTSMNKLIRDGYIDQPYPKAKRYFCADKDVLILYNNQRVMAIEYQYEQVVITLDAGNDFDERYFETKDTEFDVDVYEKVG